MCVCVGGGGHFHMLINHLRRLQPLHHLTSPETTPSPIYPIHTNAYNRIGLANAPPPPPTHPSPLSPSVLFVPPQAVSVVQLSNSSSINVSWEPPPHSTLTGIIHEYRVRPPP